MSQTHLTDGGVVRMRLFLDTCLRLPKKQLLLRVLHAVWVPGVPALPDAMMRPLPAFERPITQRRVLGDDGTFTFLNQDGRCDSAEGWQDLTNGLLWTFNLHYFGDLITEGAGARKSQHIALMERWYAENPAAAGVGWMPYPVSLRISNWIKWHYWAGPLPDVLVRSLAQQAAWLYRRCEFHLRGNHLFENAKALCMAGIAIETPDAKRWLKLGISILQAELPDQILRDGGHCERSPMYHALILEAVLDLLNLCKHSNTQGSRELVAMLRPTVSPMLRWLDSMSHPDGEIAFFNDAALDIAPNAERLHEYAARVIGKRSTQTSSVESLHLEHSGFTRMARGKWVVIADIGPVGAREQPGHAHADSLSVEVSFGHQRIFVNSGVSTYAAGPDRAYERGTAAHNCVELAGIDSSEVWSSFRVARRANVSVHDIDLLASTARLRASHDGYRRLRNKPVVHREVRLSAHELVIADSVSIGGSRAISRLHVHPDVQVDTSSDASNLIWIELPSGERLALRHNSVRAVVGNGFWRPKFGRKVPNLHIEFDVPIEGLTIRVSVSDQSRTVGSLGSDQLTGSG